MSSVFWRQVRIYQLQHTTERLLFFAHTQVVWFVSVETANVRKWKLFSIYYERSNSENVLLLVNEHWTQRYRAKQTAFPQAQIVHRMSQLFTMIGQKYFREAINWIRSTHRTRRRYTAQNVLLHSWQKKKPREGLKNRGSVKWGGNYCFA